MLIEASAVASIRTVNTSEVFTPARTNVPNVFSATLAALGDAALLVTARPETFQLRRLLA